MSVILHDLIWVSPEKPLVQMIRDSVGSNEGSSFRSPPSLSEADSVVHANILRNDNLQWTFLSAAELPSKKEEKHECLA